MQPIAAWLVARPERAVFILIASFLLPITQILGSAILVLLVLSRGLGRAAVSAVFSFGALLATALTGKYPERINRIFYIDAFVPLPGQSYSDIAGEKISRQIKAYTDMIGGNNMIPPFFETDTRYCSHPLHTLYTKVNYDPAALNQLNPVYIECTNKDPDWTFTPILEKTAKNARDLNWQSHIIKSDHMPMYSHTEELCNLLFTDLKT